MLIDVTRLVGRALKERLPTGVDRVMLAYIGHFGTRSRAVVHYAGHTIIVPDRASQDLFAWLLAPTCNFPLSRIQLAAQNFLSFGRADEVRGSVLLNTGHGQLDDTRYLQNLKKMEVKPVFFIHDLIPITHPEYCRTGDYSKHVMRMENVLAYGAAVITNSQTTLNDLRGFALAAGHPMPPAMSALLAPAALPSSGSTRLLPQPYFVVLGTIEGRKNHLLLLQVWRRLAEKLGNATPKLVIIGQRGWECESVIDMLERCKQLRGHVLELGNCPDGEMATWLAHAQALLFPSFTEGYGMPLVEALSLRVPVIASSLPAFQEVAGNIPDYLDPMDVLGWMALIERYTDPNSSDRRAQLARLAQFEAPTWAAHFESVDDFLKRLP